jgi:DNA-binding MarR family transcriptional regulator
MRQVAQEHLIVPSAATRLVDELVTKGLVERVTSDQDRRVVRLKISSQGKEIIDKVHEEAFPLLARILKKMTPDEQDALITGLNALIRSVGQVEAESE